MTVTVVGTLLLLCLPLARAAGCQAADGLQEPQYCATCTECLSSNVREAGGVPQFAESIWCAKDNLDASRGHCYLRADQPDPSRPCMGKDFEHLREVEIFKLPQESCAERTEDKSAKYLIIGVVAGFCFSLFVGVVGAGLYWRHRKLSQAVEVSELQSRNKKKPNDGPSEGAAQEMGLVFVEESTNPDAAQGFRTGETTPGVLTPGLPNIPNTPDGPEQQGSEGAEGATSGKVDDSADATKALDTMQMPMVDTSLVDPKASPAALADELADSGAGPSQL